MFDLLREPFAYLFRPAERLYWPYLIAALAIALFIYIKRTGPDASLRSFLSYCFPKSIWSHRSTRTDLLFFVLNRILFLALFTPAMLIIFPWVNSSVAQALSQLSTPMYAQAQSWMMLVYGALVVLAVDFATFFGHYLSHKVDFLWQFHKVHHSAAVLNPFTVYRMHPMDDLLTLTIGGCLAALLHALFSFYFVNDPSFWTFNVVAAVAMVFYFAGYNLRHSHVWLSYGPVVSRWLISPAQHQIHHSCKPEHLGKNLGLIFAIWDRLFGTLYVPEQPEELTLGLLEEPQDNFNQPLDCYLRPFVTNFGRHRASTVVATVALAGIASFAVAQAVLPATTPSVMLESLTWKEVETLIERGYRTAIVPTGGTEQNGEHLILGKHQAVIGHTAVRIAKELGQALVAPTLDYVPEGSITPPEGHMAFAGTLSVRESTFEALLEDAARSLVQHGFQRILFIGDSGGNQAAQARVAAALTAEFASTGVQVLNVSDYYSANGQLEWLKSQGFTDAEVGFHAGVRDSSEMLIAQPDGVRMLKLRASGQRSGVSGAYWKATPELGQKMLDLKVEAALRQIRTFADPVQTE